MKQLGIFILLGLLVSACGAKKNTQNGANVRLGGGDGGQTCTMIASTGLAVQIILPAGYQASQYAPAFQVVRSGSADPLDADYNQTGNIVGFTEYETPAGTYSVSVYYNNQRVALASNVPVRMGADGCHPDAQMLQFTVSNGQLVLTGQSY